MFFRSIARSYPGAALSLTLLLGVGCAGQGASRLDAEPDQNDTGQPADDPRPEEPFETASELPLSQDGETDPFDVPLGPGHDALVIRARFPGPAGAFCVQLDAMTDSDGGVWIPPATSNADWGDHCTTCAQRTSVGEGYGLFVFPTSGDPLPSAASVSARVALRDCATRLPFDPALHGPAPGSVVVETRRVKARDPDGRRTLSVVFGFTGGTQFDATSAADDEVFAGALAHLAETLDLAGIDLDVAGHIALPQSASPVVYGRAGSGALDALQQQATEAMAPLGIAARATLLVIFTPCLVREDSLGGAPIEPEGVAARIPAGYPAGGRADAVFLKGAPCDAAAGPAYWPSGAALGKVLSHEIGHALGLYHSVEADGAEDHLDDTGPDNFMFHLPLASSAQGVSPRQRRVMRVHPLVTM